MRLIHVLLEIFFHLDRHLDTWTHQLGGWLYLLLFTVIFCETGLVVTPFLPGDSLLFAVGAIAAVTSLNLPVMIALLMTAAVLGDAVNYSIGYKVGPKVFTREASWLWNKKHLLRAQAFYERYGGKTIFLARFVPIIRTFAPFVAGIGQMKYRRFAMFNVTGGIAWVLAFTLGGRLFGQTETVKRNFHYVIVAIIVISVLPGVIEFFRERSRARSPAPASDKA